MVARVRGRFGDFTAEIVTADDPLESAVTATIQVASVDTGNADRDAHLRNADFFEADRYPTITYRSTGLRPDGEVFALNGELTIKDVTRPVPLRLELGGFGPDYFLEDPSKGARAGFTATGRINRLDFGVGGEGTVPGGAVVLAHSIDITLDIEAVLKTD
ncbi:YceI family protein [Actinomadura sp. NPDC047616]|uniref:YceI family protein n=1 Tax=Actinomadura sp. NPDC047616 TaxID=3155914 RepID=UPI0033EDF172